MIRIGVVQDYLEERWPSMDLAAEMLLDALRREHAATVDAVALRPVFRARVARLPWPPALAGRARNADRLLNRFWDYPRWLRARRSSSDVFHLCDHSYSQLVTELPPGRAGVYCHDIDTFRCLVEPALDPRPPWFRAMAARVLRGFRAAAVVFHSTRAVREELERHALVDPGRLVHAPLGVAPEFRPGPGGPPPVEGRFVLHVGSMATRKRIDVLLDVFAALAQADGGLRLVQVGGPWSEEHRRLIGRHGVAERVVQVSGVSRSELARLYRAAALVLQPSEREGFGLPVLEALACGAQVLASDLPVFREVGGSALTYAPVGDVAAWVSAARDALERPERAPPRAARLARAAELSWSRHAETIVGAYRRLAGAAK